MMTVGQLKEELEGFDDNNEVIVQNMNTDVFWVLDEVRYDTYNEEVILEFSDAL